MKERNGVVHLESGISFRLSDVQIVERTMTEGVGRILFEKGLANSCTVSWPFYEHMR